MSSRPPSGSMVNWRFRTKAPCAWSFGYVTYPETGCDKVRMGRWNGDSHGGQLVSVGEIEWERHS